MKRILIFLFILSVMSLTSCNSENVVVGTEEMEQTNTVSDSKLFEEVVEFVKPLYSCGELAEFDPGHTNALVKYMTDYLLQAGDSSVIQGQDYYSVDKNTLNKKTLELFDVPEGFLSRLPENDMDYLMEYGVVGMGEEIRFYQEGEKRAAEFEVLETWMKNGVYHVALCRNDDSGEPLTQAVLSVLKTGDGKLKVQSCYRDQNLSPFYDTGVRTKITGKSQEYLEMLSAKRQTEGESFVGKTDVDESEMRSISSFVQNLLYHPVLGNFDENHLYGAVIYSMQKILRDNLAYVQYHSSADYYTIDILSLKNYMSEIFALPDDFESQIREIDSNDLRRVNDQLVFYFHNTSFGNEVVVDQVEKSGEEILFYGHGVLQEKIPDNADELLGYARPITEFAGVLVRTGEGAYKIKEFVSK